ncbi:MULTISPECIES: dTMP kinase [Clostridium]|uniref:Thymidylate kinase n=1 Tax=Clostridium novyi (strain NT) TaxID=386415 RepID=KTHY_CLONN|nr:MULTISPECIES: dTMP kinase [Clostridium]A0Q3M5.1 RecName: Full=Thymidylate kinase; AltName: Full=dTMP kinase [Clostridium novyi NT]ABK62224.1 thymidylate kinase [Clostridium novyi NT]KEH86620.1 thymidylate kinase [Clostridium novyi A str. NCTC 538]KEH89206.1 thymidylate kinase [Clostridium novyi A str. 4540]KEH94117.1 thymidylate kinase [Clostridium botulinum C/D str. It1]KEH95402.1 thymidylate kinase [Clostridium novyi A str. GD211209]
MNKGAFITLEGPEGSGKTTIVKMIEKYLSENNIEYISTREPGGINISEQIRDVILNKDNVAMDARTEALLYVASRRQHLAERVIPAIKEGKVVICDRFIDSSLAYQGYARGIGIDEVMAINEFAIDGYMPDLTLYLDIEPEVGLKRISKNNEREVNRLDLEALDFHKKVREGYFKLLEKYPNRIKKINANQPVDKVFEEVKGFLK